MNLLTNIVFETSYHFIMKATFGKNNTPGYKVFKISTVASVKMGEFSGTDALAKAKAYIERIESKLP